MKTNLKLNNQFLELEAERLLVGGGVLIFIARIWEIIYLSRKKSPLSVNFLEISDYALELK
jgi:hypothetical protein